MFHNQDIANNQKLSGDLSILRVIIRRCIELETQRDDDEAPSMSEFLFNLVFIHGASLEYSCWHLLVRSIGVVKFGYLVCQMTPLLHAAGEDYMITYLQALMFEICNAKDDDEG